MKNKAGKKANTKIQKSRKIQLVCLLFTVILLMPKGSVLASPVDRQPTANRALTIYNSAGRDVDDAFVKKYPDSPLIVAGEGKMAMSSEEVFQAVQSGDDAIDIFLVELWNSDFEKIMKKEFAYSLTESELIQENIYRMYPYIQEKMTYNGKIYGVPLDVCVVPTLSYNMDAFREAELTQKDLPKSYMEYLDLYIYWMRDLQLQHPQAAFFGNACTKEALMHQMTNHYIAGYLKKEEIVNFDTQLFRNLTAKIDEVLQVQKEEGMDSYNRWEENDIPILFQNIGFFGMEDDGFPLIVPLDLEGESAEVSSCEVLFINPVSQNKQLALAYLEMTTRFYNPISQISIYQDSNEPIAREGYEEMIEYHKKELERLNKELMTAAEDEKALIEEEILIEQQELDRKDDIHWEISAQAISYYNENISCFILPQGNMILMDAEHGSEESAVSKLLRQYVEGAITLDEYIIQANRRIEIMAFESD